MTTIIEPKISSYADLCTLREAIEQPLDAIVWIGSLDYHAPNGSLIETGFFMNASSQGFRVMLSREPHSPSFWCPWDRAYIFYVMLHDKEGNENATH